ncbi:hypothetical protein F4777DRAFT_570117 [Nemania sp. FL0916]|nr:hypothetical protein F4777DRAFT_570117 [Nemania sp. FL0916]
MATIKPIEAKSIHQIQSGQVIVDLCSVVKELVENSIDAGATNIEVRFKNQGLDAIEVQDNGSGISKDNYASLALKHYTSKLSTYSDLESLETFGFRGEALSSLCALSKFSVTTCLASDAPRGSRLEFETSGNLCGTGVVAAQKGTTVLVESLFHNLPVRRRELERNIKREWNKVLVVLNQYACIQTKLKFSVSQQPNKGKRIVLFSTKGNQTTRENIVNVFGAKTLAVLIPLDLELELEPTPAAGRRLNSQGDGEAKTIRVRGHVSRPAYGEGRQTPDRQMFFVNGRPCGLPQFAKVFNEVYKSYNASQSPFIFADIQLDTHLYDVNVSPDKRTILLHDQTRMLDNLRESLSALFESQDYALPTSNLQTSKQPLTKRSSLNTQDKPSPTASMDRVASAGPDHPSELTPVVTSSQAIDYEMEVSIGNDAQVSDGSSLISRWAERKCDVRGEAGVKGSRVTTHVSDETGGSRAPSRCSSSPDVDVEKSLSNEDSDEAPDRVAEFRARLEELKDGKNRETMTKSSGIKTVPSEPLIPALASPVRVSDINSSRTHSSPLAKRTAPEVATITIGGQTVTSIIGSAPKKARLEYQPKQGSSTRGRTKTPVPMPSFNGRLTQMFAAQADRSRPDGGELTATAEMRDDAQRSDSFSEQLFLTDDSEKESDNESIANIASEATNQEISSREASHASPTVLRRDSEPISPSPMNYSDIESKERKSAQAKEESEVVENATGAQASKDTASDEAQKRTQSFVKGGSKKKDATYHLQQSVRVDGASIRSAFTTRQKYVSRSNSSPKAALETDRLDADDAEEKLSLTISKSDFESMKILGQFNLGFILASRAAEGSNTGIPSTSGRDDELFIIDQHATDEKYNFERLQASTVVQSQRLVHPKTLELTAVEEDIVQENIDALEKNGFIVKFDDSGDQPVGTRCQLLSLPLSRETTFSLADLEELISLLQDHQSTSANTVPRPSRVRKMFAMRACRSSVMIGKSLSTKQMEKLVRHMSELDKPWNCPHGRPTMRHLCGLSAWDDLAWNEGDGFDRDSASPTDWGAYINKDRDTE